MTIQRRTVHVLTPGFTSPNGRALLMPLIVHGRVLRDAGLRIGFFSSPTPELSDCDVLLIDSKHYSPRWARESDAVLEEIASLRERIGCVIFMGILDSAGADHMRSLPFVTLYCKAQLLRDRTAYLRPLYGYRAYSDYYHDKEGVEDEMPVLSEPVPDAGLLEKLTVHWNSALADYSWLGPYRMAAHHRLGWRWLLGYGARFIPPSPSRPRPLSCRIGTAYLRRSVAWQRRAMAERLHHRLDTGKLTRRRYLAELRQSRVVISPFGLGEITLRDFEVFIAGALLLKPDMSHMETWPDLFVSDETMIPHSWNLADLEERIETALADYDRHVEIAREGQERYRRHLTGPEAGRLFAERLLFILGKAERLSQ